jgi:hypothetical protein
MKTSNRKIVDTNKECVLLHHFVTVIQEHLNRIHGGNDVLNRLEAEQIAQNLLWSEVQNPVSQDYKE